MTEEGRGVDDGIPPLGPRLALLTQGARWEVSHRLCRMDCHRQSIPTTTASACRGFESRHANKEKLLIYQSFYFSITAKNAIFGSLPLRSAHNSDKWHFNAWFRINRFKI